MSTRGEQQHAEMIEVLRSIEYALNEASKSKGSVELQGSNPVPFAIAAGQTDGQLRPTRVANVLLGWSIRETTGVGSAVVILRDGGDATADEVGSVTLAAGASVRDLFPFGISLTKGLYLDVQSGAVAGTIYLGNT